MAHGYSLVCAANFLFIQYVMRMAHLALHNYSTLWSSKTKRNNAHIYKIHVETNNSISFTNKTWEYYFKKEHVLCTINFAFTGFLTK